MRSRRKWTLLGCGVPLVVVALVVLAGYLWFQRFRTQLWARGGSALLGIKAGDVVPAGGLTITKLGTGANEVTLVFPIVLYPGARIQGVNITTMMNASGDATVPHAVILMGTEDPEEAVVRCYMAAWSDFRPKVYRPKNYWPIYGPTVSTLAATLVITEERSKLVNSVDVQTGPGIQVMDDVRYLRCLYGKERLPLEAGGRKMTEVWLSTPIYPASPAQG